jgi:hypothetical protein
MKFVSKHANLLVVLRPGLPANTLAGVVARPGLHVKFRNGVVEIFDQNIIDQLKTHPGFNIDYVSIEDTDKDPYEKTRGEKEPPHAITELKYGHIESKTTSKKTQLTPEVEKIISKMAEEKAAELLPKMVEEAIEKIAKNYQEKQVDKTKKVKN